jgi:hypothetical protein
MSLAFMVSVAVASFSRGGKTKNPPLWRTVGFGKGFVKILTHSFSRPPLATRGLTHAAKRRCIEQALLVTDCFLTLRARIRISSCRVPDLPLRVNC